MGKGLVNLGNLKESNALDQEAINFEKLRSAPVYINH